MEDHGEDGNNHGNSEKGEEGDSFDGGLKEVTMVTGMTDMTHMILIRIMMVITRTRNRFRMKHAAISPLYQSMRKRMKLHLS